MANSGDTDKINLIEIQSLIDAHLLYAGKATLRQYEWKKAGDIVLVDNKDALELLEKRLGIKQCCGDQNGNKIFQIVGG